MVLSIRFFWPPIVFLLQIYIIFHSFASPSASIDINLTPQSDRTGEDCTKWVYPLSSHSSIFKLHPLTFYPAVLSPSWIQQHLHGVCGIQDQAVLLAPHSSSRHHILNKMSMIAPSTLSVVYRKIKEDPALSWSQLSSVWDSIISMSLWKWQRIKKRWSDGWQRLRLSMYVWFQEIWHCGFQGGQSIDQKLQTVHWL